jgi:hypothetical protein
LTSSGPVPGSPGSWEIRFTCNLAEAEHLHTVLEAVGSVPGVFDAYRVTQ